MPALREGLDWDYFGLDGFSWTDFLRFLGVPHYSNGNHDDQQPLMFEIRTVEYDASEYDFGGRDQQQFLVIWRPETPRPTDEQIATLVESEGY